MTTVCAAVIATSARHMTESVRIARWIMSLIKREDLIDHLNACIAESDGGTPITDAVLVAIRCAVEQMPEVDAVPVVRCGECKNYDVETAWCKIHSCFVNSNGDFCHPWESNEWKMFDGAYYCADGERRADNG